MLDSKLSKLPAQAKKSWMQHCNDSPNQHENSHKLYDETAHPIASLKKSPWKLRQKYDQNFPI